MKSPQLTKIFGPKPVLAKLSIICLLFATFIVCVWLFIFRGHTEITRVQEAIPGVVTCNAYILENGMRIDENCKLEAIPGFKGAQQRPPNADVAGSPQKGDRVLVFTDIANIQKGAVNTAVIRLPF